MAAQAAEADALRSPTGSAAGDLSAAAALAPADRAQAYEILIDNWPDTVQAREAGLRLGDIRRAANDMGGAVTAYAGALTGWPTTAWAGETTLKLARALIATDRKPQACGAWASSTAATRRRPRRRSRQSPASSRPRPPAADLRGDRLGSRRAGLRSAGRPAAADYRRPCRPGPVGRRGLDGPAASGGRLGEGDTAGACSPLAITIDHGLNPASPAWGQTCRRACEGLGVDWIERRWRAISPRPA